VAVEVLPLRAIYTNSASPRGLGSYISTPAIYTNPTCRSPPLRTIRLILMPTEVGANILRSPGLRLVGETLFGTDARTGATADTVLGILQRHHHDDIIIKIVIVLIVVAIQFKLIALYKIQYITRTHLEAASTTDAFALIKGYYELRGVLISTQG
jgi:hypothetical protein